MTLTSTQVSSLRELEKALGGRGIVVIGATALGFYYDMSWRKTVDVDLIVAAELDEFPCGIDKIDGWTRHPTRAHEFRSALGVKLDIVPAGPKLLASGILRWPSGYEMSLLGFDLAFDHAAEHPTADGYPVRVAPPPVIAILKMAAYLDRPAERVRDLVDLGFLLDSYIDDEEERRFDEGAAAGEYDLVSAYLLGVDAERICGPRHHDLVDKFLAAIGGPEEMGHAEMLHAGPDRWRTEPDALARRIRGFRAGREALRRLL